MASGMYNRGKFTLLSSTGAQWDDAGATFGVLLTTSSYTPADTHNTVSDITNELSGGNYSRQAVTSRTLTEVDGSDRAVLDAADVTWTALGAAAGTPKYAVVYAELSASDSNRHLIGWIDLGSAPTPNGGDYTVAWSASGFAYQT